MLELTPAVQDAFGLNKRGSARPKCFPTCLSIALHSNRQWHQGTIEAKSGRNDI